MLDQPLASLLRKVREIAVGAGCIVVEETPIRGEGAPMILFMEPQPYLDLLSRCRPSILYLETTTFNAYDHVVMILEPRDHDEEQLIAADKRVKLLIKNWSDRGGQLFCIEANFVKDGVLHVMIELADWRDDFTEQAEAVGSLLVEEAESEHGNLVEAKRAEFREHANTLRTHPKFNGSPKPSREKRLFLASQLFPESDAEFLARVVDLAANLEWLES